MSFCVGFVPGIPLVSAYGLQRTSLTRSHVCASAATTAKTATKVVPFRKYHGLGNDFILVDNRQEATPTLRPDDAVRLCNRNTGVGADGVIFLLPPQTENADAQMRLFNADGSEPEMCGNGIRCLARFAADLGVATAKPGELVVDTPAGPMVPQLLEGSSDVRVDMGPPELVAAKVPTKLNTSAGNAYTASMDVEGTAWNITAVSMGNPHAITFVSKETYDAMDKDLERAGPLFENHAMFPARTNTEFVRVVSATEMDMLVWERGSGRTMACGTGACAVAVAAILTGKAEKDTQITVHLPGGDLVIEWSSPTNHVYMTGPAQLVFTGELEVPSA